MGNAAKQLGIGTYDTPAGALRGRRQTEILNVSSSGVARAVAPRESTMVIAPKMRDFDLALEGYGQGYAGQMTPLQMALSASAIANLEGKLMKPKIEYNLPNAVFAQVITRNKRRERRIVGWCRAARAHWRAASRRSHALTLQPRQDRPAEGGRFTTEDRRAEDCEKQN